jgi:hypothetical protein
VYYETAAPGEVIPLTIDGETWFESESRLRSRRSKYIKPVYDVITAPPFNVFIFGLIVFSTCMLALDDYPGNKTKTLLLENINFVLNWVFLAEMLVKVYGLGLTGYFRDSYNVFDFFIVCVSILDMTLEIIRTS